MENFDVEKSKILTLVEVGTYISKGVEIKTILNKVTGNIKVISIDSDAVLTGRISPFDTFVHVIEGSAEIVIDDQSKLLETGKAIIIPAHSRNELRATIRCKVIMTIIKSGYEELL